MTTEELAMLAVGQIIAAGMFALGVLVGSSLNRKDAKDDDSDKGTKANESGWWHDPVGTSTQGGARRGGGSGAGEVGATRASERVPVGRGTFWE